VTTFAVARDHPSFEGHFPDAPVLPGVVILAEAIARIAQATATQAAEWKLESGKFHGAVAPGAALEITHAPRGAGTHGFEVRDGARLVASGTLARRTTA
jgi:3-hydroxymyristoyl/3-hydroxydecanoyl-(acyl carrier protein) dehydratase